MPRFPVAFRPPAFASWSSIARRGTGPPSRSAYRPPHGTGPQAGLSRSTRTSCNRGGCLLNPGDSGAHTADSSSPAATCRITAATSLNPGAASIKPRLQITRHPRRFTHVHPSGLPQPVTPGWNGHPWAILGASHLAVTSDARPSGDRHRALAWDYAVDISRPPFCESTRNERPRVARKPSDYVNNQPRTAAYHAARPPPVHIIRSST